MLKAEILPLQAHEIAAWGAGGSLAGLTRHSDRGSNYTAAVYTNRVLELGALASTRAVGDSHAFGLRERGLPGPTCSLVRARLSRPRS